MLIKNLEFPDNYRKFEWNNNTMQVILIAKEWRSGEVEYKLGLISSSQNSKIGEVVLHIPRNMDIP